MGRDASSLQLHTNFRLGVLVCGATPHNRSLKADFPKDRKGFLDRIYRMDGIELMQCQDRMKSKNASAESSVGPALDLTRLIHKPRVRRSKPSTCLEIDMSSPVHQWRGSFARHSTGPTISRGSEIARLHCGTPSGRTPRRGVSDERGGGKRAPKV